VKRAFDVEKDDAAAIDEDEFALAMQEFVDSSDWYSA
jgi:hypothetical protein